MGISPTGSAEKGAAIGRRNGHIKNARINFRLILLLFTLDVHEWID